MTTTTATSSSSSSSSSSTTTTTTTTTTAHFYFGTIPPQLTSDLWCRSTPSRFTRAAISSERHMYASSSPFSKANTAAVFPSCPKGICFDRLDKCSREYGMPRWRVTACPKGICFDRLDKCSRLWDAEVTSSSQHCTAPIRAKQKMQEKVLSQNFRRQNE